MSPEVDQKMQNNIRKTSRTKGKLSQQQEVFPTLRAAEKTRVWKQKRKKTFDRSISSKMKAF